MVDLHVVLLPGHLYEKLDRFVNDLGNQGHRFYIRQALPSGEAGACYDHTGFAAFNVACVLPFPCLPR